MTPWSDRFGRLPKAPWYDRAALRLVLWALRRQPAWLARHPHLKYLYAWHPDSGPIVLVFLNWTEPANGALCKIEFRGDVFTVVKTLIEFTDGLPNQLGPNRPEDDPHYNANLITRKDI